MAGYKHQRFLSQESEEVYDRLLLAGVDAPMSGIYRCVACGREVCVLEGTKLPPQNHHAHKVNFVQIQWRLVVKAEPDVK